MSIADDEKRVAQILGTKEGEKLPEVSEEYLEMYHQYLNDHLSFPFEAEYSKETGPMEDTHYGIKVTGLSDPDESPDVEFYGLFCYGKQGRRKVVVPLAEVEAKEKGENEKLVDDYRIWFWNYR